ncbi:MAG: ABC transporter ATP-binding protein [bacterium]|nr:ABC transporter ATP-binding protein [bacterium]
MPPHESKGNIRIWPVLRVYIGASLNHPWMLGVAILGVVGAQVAGVVAPLYLRTFIDVLASGERTDATVHALLITLGAFGLVALAGWTASRIRTFAKQRVEADVMAELEHDAFGTLLRQDYDFFISSFVGTLTRRVTRYSRAYEQVLDSLLEHFLPTLIFATGTIVVLYLRNHWLGLGLLVWVIVFMSIQIVLTRWRHPLRVARVAEDSRMTGAISDAISNHSVVTLFAAERYEEENVGAIVKVWRAITLRSWNADAVIQAVQDALAIAVELGLLAAAVFLWRRGIVTVGDFALIQFYIIRLVGQVWNIGNTLRRTYDAFADASEMVDILERPRMVDDAPNAHALILKSGAIELSDVSFAFDKSSPVLTDFSLDIRGAEKIALVGPSGAGKSTITRLLLRLYDPSAGAVRIDGQDLREVTLESLRRAIAYVPQEPTLFHRTLRDNIRYGRQEATDEEVIEAARRAHCHEFISALPEGYDTLVGERGIKLSGGERQRVAIARAILKDAPILILDEATSSLDSESEVLIQTALTELMVGKTVIAIAHRLSTIMKMDRIIVVEAGKAILSGTHSELLAQESNLYKKLWDIQAGGFIRGND